MLSIGLMSGSAMDGIDAALIETNGTAESLQALGHCSLQYDPAFITLLKGAEYTVRQYQGNWDKAVHHYPEMLAQYLREGLQLSAAAVTTEYQHLSHYLHAITGRPSLTLTAVIEHSTRLHAVLVKQLLQNLHLNAQDIAVVGYHGQALFHQPKRGISIVVGDGKALSHTLQIPVIHDFRRQDVEAGGQGAPFAPLYHQALSIRDKKTPLAVLNCGGIANISLIPTENPQDLIGFDTGPGNVLLDQLVKQRTHGKETHDKDGHYGQAGQVNKRILEALYAESCRQDNAHYFLQPPPKSLDYGDFSLIPALQRLSLPDACRTLAAFTADAIVRALDLLELTHIKKPPQNWVLAGGGWKNPVICFELQTRLTKKLGKKTQIFHADVLGWSSQYMEAELFAYLAVRHLTQQPISYPNITGVPYPLVGGTLNRVNPV